jgi:hypothetical protein
MRLGEARSGAEEGIAMRKSEESLRWKVILQDDRNEKTALGLTQLPITTLRDKQTPKWAGCTPPRW